MLPSYSEEGTPSGQPLEAPQENRQPVDEAGASQQVQVLRARVRVQRKLMNAARFDYLYTLLELRTLQGDAAAIDRLTRQISNLLNRDRPHGRTHQSKETA